MPIAILAPTGPGTFSEWTPSAGTNWEAVLSPGSPFVFAASAGLRDRYTFGDLPADATGVTSVAAFAMIGASTLTSTAQLTLRLSGTESSGATFLPAEGGYNVSSAAFTEAPGALAWTVARVNALEAGPDTVDPPDAALNVDRFWLLVDYESSTPASTRVAETVLMPATAGRDVAVSGSVVADLPADGNREATVPGAAALDIPDGFATQPAVELEEEGV